jgi:adenosylhomocysteinase
MPKEKYRKYVDSVLDFKPHITLDDGADLIATIHKRRQDLLKNIIGGTEETTTGVIRIKSLARMNLLKYPLIAVNDSETKYLFDNRYGTGQSTIDGILRASNVLLAGKNFVVCGFGWCGRGIALRARGMGAKVIVCEVDPLKALEAVMEGYQVMPLTEACKIGDIFITATGNREVIDAKHLIKMKTGAILGNSGHFNIEVNMEYLERNSVKKQRIRPMLDEYTFKDGKKLYVIGEGRLANLTAAEGHPATVMDLSFSDQALSVEYLVKNKGKLNAEVYKLPKVITDKIAQLKLNTLGVKIDSLTIEQQKYLQGWEEGAFG